MKVISCGQNDTKRETGRGPEGVVNRKKKPQEAEVQLKESSTKRKGTLRINIKKKGEEVDSSGRLGESEMASSTRRNRGEACPCHDHSIL